MMKTMTSAGLELRTPKLISIMMTLMVLLYAGTAATQPPVTGLCALPLLRYFGNFRLDALALSVIATATWLAGWLGGWVSVTAGIVSKRLNLSENFFDLLIAPS